MSRLKSFPLSYILFQDTRHLIFVSGPHWAHSHRKTGIAQTHGSSGLPPPYSLTVILEKQGQRYQGERALRLGDGRLNFCSLLLLTHLAVTLGKLLLQLGGPNWPRCCEAVREWLICELEAEELGPVMRALN